MADVSDPIQLEERYQALKADLRRTATARWHLERVRQFLATCPLDDPGVEGYLLELMPVVADLTGQLDPTGSRPEPLVGLAESLEGLEAPASVGSERRAAVEHLRRAAARLYAYAGAPRRARTVLRGGAAEEASGPSIEAEEAASPRARLAAALSQVDGPAADALRSLHDTWDRAVDGLPVPVVERDGETDSLLGRLLAVRVNLYALDPPADDLTVEGRWKGATGDPSGIEPVLPAARRWLETADPPLAGCRVAGRVRLGEGRVETMGQSVQLGVAVQFVASLMAAAERRIRYRPAVRTAMTGRLDSEGNVQSVESNSLPTKVEAAFFSPVETLAVPQAQAARAGQARDRLLERYPHGALDVVGAGTLRDVFDRRRLTERVETGRVRHAAQQAWRRKGGILSAVLIVGLALGLAWVLFGPFDKNPVQAQFTGETMLVQNAAGRTIERISVGGNTVQSVHGGHPVDFVEFADLTGDGRNEVIWGERINEQENVPEQIHCKDVGVDSTRWTIPLRFETPFPQKTIPREDVSLVDLHAGDLDGNGQIELYAAVRNRPYFPSLLLKFDAQTGTEQARYLHAGHFRHAPFEVAPLDDDGAKELLIGAHSNVYEDAVLIVLDPRRMQGHGPVRGDYRVKGLRPARHDAYLRFPSTRVGRAAPQIHPFVQNVQVDPRSELLTAQVQEGRLPSGGPSFLIVSFTFGLEPVSVGTSSWWDRLAERLVRQGRLDAVPDQEDFERYKSEIRYWTGSGWTRESTERSQ